MKHFWESSLFPRTMFALGVLLVLVVAPLAGLLPGPGGIVVVAAGLSLMLRHSLWAKRHYVRFSRRWPRHGARADWALRRKRGRKVPEKQAAAD